MCDGFDDNFSENEDDIKKYGILKIVYTMFKNLPTIILRGVVVTILLYKTAHLLHEHLTSKNTNKRLIINEDYKFHSKFDVLYCLKLANRHRKKENEDESDSDSDEDKKEETEHEKDLKKQVKEQEENNIKTLKGHTPDSVILKKSNSFDTIDTKKTEKTEKKKNTFGQKLKKIFRKKIYRWDPNFKFSSRVINAHVVAFLALYAVFITYFYQGYLSLQSKINQSNDLIGNIFGSFDFTDLIDLPFDEIKVKQSYLIGFIVSCVLAALICILQALLGLKHIKKDLKSFYKGKKFTSNHKIANHKLIIGYNNFSGFLAAFLVNGFIIISTFFFLICCLCFYIDASGNTKVIEQVVLKLVPIIVVFIVKFIFNLIWAKFIFLQEKGKYLAIDNYRAYAVFSYVVFFFDCFVGIINAVIRFVIGFLGSLFFMPRIGYSFLGKHLQKFDQGFKVSNGFFNVESCKLKTHINFNFLKFLFRKICLVF